MTNSEYMMRLAELERASRQDDKLARGVLWGLVLTALIGIVAILVFAVYAAPVHAKPCGHGYISASKTCHR